MQHALLLVDIQNDYFPGGKMELVGIEKAVDNTVMLLDRFRKESKPIIHVQHVATRPGSSFFLPETDGVKIHKKVTPQNDEALVIKHFPNSFRETELLQQLTQKGVEHLVICGAMTHMCIDATVRAAFDLGIQCTVAHDCCATKDLIFEDKKVLAADVHGSFMAALAGVYAEVVTAEQLVNILFNNR